MRIRSTKPEFWRSKTASERLLAHNHLPRLIYSGPVGNIKDWHAMGSHHPALPRSTFTSFVYHLFDIAGDPIYFGTTSAPAYRFSAHQRRPWWPQAAHLNLYVISCESHPDECCRGWGSKPRSVVERAAWLWENKAINDVQPRCNVAGVDANGAKGR